jgi:hypothetical protein
MGSFPQVSWFCRSARFWGQPYPLIPYSNASFALHYSGGADAEFSSAGRLR